MINITDLRSIVLPVNRQYVDLYYPWYEKLLAKWGIVGKDLENNFFAQVLHESAEFRYVREIADGSVYEGRKDLGNIYPGDGKRFRGRGHIQITGRDNYKKCGKALLDDELFFITSPSKLEEPEYATESACWFWSSHGLNNPPYDLRRITKVINGGYNGLEQRRRYYESLCRLN